MISIIDYGAGNLFSVKNALDYLNIPSVITNEKSIIGQSDKMILPGVGAFPDAMKMLNAAGLTGFIKEQSKQKPLLGICLGMQILFEKGFEFGETEGLGLLGGSVIKMMPKGLKIPHMGWNSLVKLNECPLLSGVPENSYVYFVHSYRAETPDDAIAAYTEYGERIPALVFKDKVFGAQFHPEKSGNTGLKILKNFGELAI